MLKHTFLALTTDELKLSSSLILGGAYVPGLVCSKCLNPLTAAVVVKTNTHLQLLDGTCAYRHHPGPWLATMRNKKYFQNSVDCTDDAKVAVHYRPHFRGLLLFDQLFPGEADTKSLLQPLRDGGEVTQDQLWAIAKFILMTGKPKNLLERRDYLMRLRILLELVALSEEERNFVVSMLDTIGDENPALSESQMITALQHKFCLEILPFSNKFLANWPPQHGSITFE